MVPRDVAAGIRVILHRHHIGVPEERPVHRIAGRHRVPFTHRVVGMALVGQRGGGSPRRQRLV